MNSTGITVVAKPVAAHQLAYVSTFLQRELEQNPQARKFALSHRTLEGGLECMLQREVDRKLKPEASRSKVGEIAQEFMDHAMQAIAHHTLPQVYTVVVLGRDGKTTLAETEFGLSPPLSSMIGNLTEPPSEVGMRAQHMRLVEGSMKMGVNATQSSNDLLFDVIKDLRAENTKLRTLNDSLNDKRFSTATLVEDLLSAKLQREIILEKHRANMKHVDQAWQQVDAIFRLLLKRNGVELPALGDGNPLEKFKKLVDGLTIEQKVQLTNILTEEQAGLFADAMKGFAAMGAM